MNESDYRLGFIAGRAYQARIDADDCQGYVLRLKMVIDRFMSDRFDDDVIFGLFAVLDEAAKGDDNLFSIGDEK